MNIGIIGSGDVGQALGRGFARHGHAVKIGTRDPANTDLVAWANDVGAQASVATVPEAAAFGELVVFAVLGSAVDAAAQAAGAANLNGKVVIDATNPLDFSGGGLPETLHGLKDSNGARLQRQMPGARVVKAFNTVPNSRMIDPGLEGVRMLICGNDAEAKKTVESLLIEAGWSGVIDIGDIDESRWLEAFVPLWARAGAALGRWDHVFDVRTG